MIAWFDCSSTLGSPRSSQVSYTRGARISTVDAVFAPLEGGYLGPHDASD